MIQKLPSTMLSETKVYHQNLLYHFHPKLGFQCNKRTFEPSQQYQTVA